MNAAITVCGYRFLGKLQLCFACYKENHFREEDCTRIRRYDLISPAHARCDYCHKLLLEDQWGLDECYHDPKPDPWYKPFINLILGD